VAAVTRQDQGLKGRLITIAIKVSSGLDLDLDIEIIATLKSNTSDNDNNVYIKVKPSLKATEGEDTVIGGDKDIANYSSIISNLM
jgi:hypothetical protein